MQAPPHPPAPSPSLRYSPLSPKQLLGGTGGRAHSSCLPLPPLWQAGWRPYASPAAIPPPSCCYGPRPPPPVPCASCQVSRPLGEHALGQQPERTRIRPPAPRETTATEAHCALHSHQDGHVNKQIASPRPNKYTYTLIISVISICLLAHGPTKNSRLSKPF